MDQKVGFDELDEVLRRCGASWDAAQTHGLLTGRLAVVGVPAGPEWLLQVLEGTNEADALRTECQKKLDILYQVEGDRKAAHSVERDATLGAHLESHRRPGRRIRCGVGLRRGAGESRRSRPGDGRRKDWTAPCRSRSCRSVPTVGGR